MLVHRPRLYRSLDAGTAAPLTLVIGPAGTGKTALVSGWLGQASDVGRVWWKNPHDKVDVGEVLLLAAGVRSGEAHALAASDDVDAVAAIQDELERHHTADEPPDLVVIDDAHLLTSSEVELLSSVLSTQPELVRLVVASRRDLPLPVFELELRGKVRTIRAGQLRFSAQESQQLLGRHLGDVPPELVQRLSDRAGGWAAALVLAARAVVGVHGDDAIGEALGRTEQPVVDFLLGETYQGLSEPVRGLLLSTYEEEGITAARAGMLSGRSDAGLLLSRLAADGLLVTAYPVEGDQDPVYAYHPLLVELLRRQAVDPSTDTSIITAAHHRAALSHAAAGEGEPALHHATACGDIDLIARMLLDHGLGLMICGKLLPINRAQAALPDDVLDRYPALTGVTGILRRLTGDPAGAIVLAAKASETAATMKGTSVSDVIERDAVRADALILQLWKTHFGWRNQAAAIAEARVALGCEFTPLHRHRSTLVLSPERQAWLLLELASAELWAGHVEEAAVHVDDGLVGAKMSNNEGLLASALSHRALIELINGHARLAADSARAAVAQIGDVHLDPMFADTAYLVLGWVAYINLDFKEAAEWLGRMTSRSTVSSGAMVVQTLAVILDCALAIETGEVDRAQRQLVHPVGAGATLPDYLVRALAVFRWKSASAADAGPMAAAQIETLRGSGFAAEADFLGSMDRCRAGDLGGALELVDRAVANPGVVDPTTRACGETAKTAIQLLRGENEAARLSLRDALAGTAPQELMYVLSIGLMAGQAFLDLLSDESQQVGAQPFAAMALGVLERHLAEQVPPSASLATPSRPSPSTGRTIPRQVPRSGRPRRADVVVNGIHTTLTERELDVLHQLALGSSYHEIALALFITENTVKTHLASSYRKLGVERRSAALRIARELDLL